MRNSLLDPPEYEEIPECCNEEMELYDDGSLKCLKCGSTIDPPNDIEPLEYELPGRDKCKTCAGNHPSRADCPPERD